MGGVILFSGAQMHSSVPNTSGVTRFSIDFRTIHLEDAIAKRGAPNIDSSCSGTVIRDYVNGVNLSRLPDDVIALFEDGTEAGGELILRPKASAGTRSRLFRYVGLFEDDRNMIRKPSWSARRREIPGTSAIDPMLRSPNLTK